MFTCRQREEERMRVEEERRLQEMMMNRHGGPMDQGGPRGRDEMMVRFSFKIVY